MPEPTRTDRPGLPRAGLFPHTRFSVLEISQFGATVLQTLVQGLVVGTTLKYLRGGMVSGLAGGTSARAALDAATDLESPSDGRFDLDLGLMADLRRARFGLTVRNLREPTFGEVEESAIQLKRHSRMGLAVLPTDGLTLAMDLDLDTVDLRDGLRRMFAFGGEGRLGPRLVVRSGVRWNLEGSRRTAGAVGMSVRIRPGAWVDGHYTQGRAEADRGFGVALRAGF